MTLTIVASELITALLFMSDVRHRKGSSRFMLMTVSIPHKRTFHIQPTMHGKSSGRLVVLGCACISELGQKVCLGGYHQTRVVKGIGT